jgi:hypothetical protein
MLTCASQLIFGMHHYLRNGENTEWLRLAKHLAALTVAARYFLVSSSI